MTVRVLSDIIESNVFVCEKGGNFIIFDAGAKFDEVQKAIKNISQTLPGGADRKDKFDAKNPQNEAFCEKSEKNFKVLGVFLTHAHYDHAFYALDYAKVFGCKVYASEFAKEYLPDAAKNYSEGKLSITDFSDFEFLHGDGRLRLGEFEVEYFALGGHSKSDVCFRVDDEIFVGDVLIGRDMGRVDLYGGSKDEMKKSLQKLVDMKYSIMHSGHGEDNTKFSQDKVAKLWLRFLNR